MKTKYFQSGVVLVGVILSSISVFADPLNNWHWRNPLPSGNPPGAFNLYGIVFTNGQFFAVGANGMEITSADGTNWIQWNTATSNQLNDIIYANGQFIAVGNNGAVETSVNGTNWVLQNSGTSDALTSVAYGNGGYVAVGGGAIIASPNGVTWTPATSGLSGASEVAGGSSGFMALSGGPQVYFSQDGMTWITNALSAPPPDPFHYEPVNASRVIFTKGTFLLAGYQNYSMGNNVYVFASSDGQNWTSNLVGSVNNNLAPFYYSFFMSGNGNAIAGGFCENGQFLLSSSDNVNWSFNTPAPSNNSLNSSAGNAGAFGNGLYVFVNSTSTMYTSTDGVNWTTPQLNVRSSTGPISTFNSITYSYGTYVVATSNLFVVSTNGSGFVAESNTPSLSSVAIFDGSFVGVGPGGAIYQSSDGLSWTQSVSGTANNLHCVAGGSNLLVTVGDSGTILTSPDGTTWASQTSHTSLPLLGVAYSNGLYVAVGLAGTTLTSPDGINWTTQHTGHANELLSITYGSAGFLAVGASGTILTSPDGVNWTLQNAGVSVSFDSATYGNGYYLITSSNAVVMTSTDGTTWTSRNIGATGNPTLYGSAFLNGRFDLVGSGGTVMESDPVPPLLVLQMNGIFSQNKFTMSFFAVPGSTFRLLSSSNLAGGAWSTVATFNNAAAVTLWTNTVTAGGRSYFRLVSP